MLIETKYSGAGFSIVPIEQTSSQAQGNESLVRAFEEMRRENRARGVCCLVVLVATVLAAAFSWHRSGAGLAVALAAAFLALLASSYFAVTAGYYGEQVKALRRTANWSEPARGRNRK